RLRHVAGEFISLEVASISVEFEGQPARLAVLRDLTERKRLQSQLSASERLASLGTLAAGIAHEINNPLAYVTLNAYGVQQTLDAMEAALRAQGHLSPDMAEQLQSARAGMHDVRDGTARVAGIVKDLKVFSRAPQAPDGPFPVDE